MKSAKELYYGWQVINNYKPPPIWPSDPEKFMIKRVHMRNHWRTLFEFVSRKEKEGIVFESDEEMYSALKEEMKPLREAIRKADAHVRRRRNEENPP